MNKTPKKKKQKRKTTKTHKQNYIYKHSQEN